MGSSSGEEDTRSHESVEEKKKKIKRGRTLLAKCNRMRSEKKKFKVEWNTRGQPIGVTRANLMSYIGISTRSRVNINYSRWDQVPMLIKEAIWKDASGIYDIPEHKLKWLIGIAGEQFRTFKSELTRIYMYDKKGNILTKPPEKCTFIDQESWDKFKGTRRSEKFKEESEKKRALVRMNKNVPKTSRLGYAGLEEILISKSWKIQENSQGPPLTASSISLPRNELWVAARIRLDGSMDDSVRKIADKMESLSRKASQGEVNLVGRHDILAAVLEKKEHPGRVRAAGSGVRISDYFGKSDKEEKEQKMQARIASSSKQEGK